MPPEPAWSPLALSGTSKPLPREKGCFQCSRRRIICDKTEPTCKKCTKKGIECSGLGRIRFAEGVARRGRLKDCKTPDPRGDDQIAHQLTAQVAYTKVRWKIDQEKREKRRNVEPEGHEGSRQKIDKQTLLNDTQTEFTSDVLTVTHDEEEEEEVMDIVRTSPPSVQPWIPLLSSEARMLFNYCRMKFTSYESTSV